MTPMMRRNAAWLPEVFNDLFNTDFMPKASATAPAINVKETDKAYIVELAAPGMTKEDFNVHINDEGNLIIKMESKQEKKDEDKSARYLRREFSYSKYEQTLILPDDVQKENISAKVEHGVLTVQLPKQVQEQVKVSRQIEIG
ncbi:MAG: Hsp20/alpha crystallin family protein [Prevotella sp.]|nr:Hsp20/alpha crystallin family protein [Prevotella sp.]